MKPSKILPWILLGSTCFTILFFIEFALEPSPAGSVLATSDIDALKAFFTTLSTRESIPFCEAFANLSLFFGKIPNLSGKPIKSAFLFLARLAGSPAFIALSVIGPVAGNCCLTLPVSLSLDLLKSVL